jgi:hypothetical protein
LAPSNNSPYVPSSLDRQAMSQVIKYEQSFQNNLVKNIKDSFQKKSSNVFINFDK